jgi:predicted RNase H-like HicB family nuclease
MWVSMKTEIIRDISYYESLPYTITIRKDHEGDFVARVQELPGCVAHGETESTAIEILRSVQKLWIEEALAAGNIIPEPEHDDNLPSGKWVQRVPRRLHRDLVNLARRDNVSLNHLVTSMLSEALTVKSCTHAFEAYISQMRTHPPRAKMLVRGDAFAYGLWHDPPHEMNQWLTNSPVRVVGDIARRLDWLSDLTRSKKISEPDPFGHHAIIAGGGILARK